MSDKPQTVWDLKRGPWTDDPMFFPPGAHPAYYRYRWTLAKLEEIGQGDSPDADYIRQKIAEFEERESELKAQYDLWLSDQR